MLHSVVSIFANTNMSTDSAEFFRESYRALTDRADPFPWQVELFLRLCAGDIPNDVVLPTGCGKTSVMTVWLLALAWQARNGPDQLTLPRRLIWVVNRRVVVDQATGEAEELQARLNDPSREDLHPVRVALAGLSGHGADDLIAVSTLRGQFADNAEWRDDPARPAIVVGTVDMIGSRLLFSGYDRGFKSRPLHAAFVGQDALLVHDEAHLEPAFQSLISAVAEEQARCHDFRPLCVVALSATSREEGHAAFRLTGADRVDREIRRRIEARKGIVVHQVESGNEVAGAVAACALGYKDSGQAILIFLYKVEDVEEVTAALRKHGARCTELTGTLRGYERDRMAREDTVFARFTLEPAITPASGTVYLVCTSAGEVGINISADHLVCDLVPFESMTQRFGRVNRFGHGEARIDIVYASGDQGGKKAPPGLLEWNERRSRTLALLHKLPPRSDGLFDGSPAALEGLPAEERHAAFSPTPEILSVTEILLDAWALTSLRNLPGRPPVTDWLHGVAEWQPAHTQVAWRQEVELITGELQTKYPPEDLLDEYPLKPHELVRDASRRVSEHLARMAKRHPDISAWVLDPNGNTGVHNLADLVSAEQPIDLSDCTVLLPPAAGGLRNGMLDGGAECDPAQNNYDVADQWGDGRRRCRVWDSDDAPEGMRQVQVIDILSGHDEEEASDTPVSAPRYWRWYVAPRSADDDGSRMARSEQEWHVHTGAAESIAQDLVSRLRLPQAEASAVVCAARWHDLGKRRDLWQRSIGNREYPSKVLAKSARAAVLFPSDYRHEFGSLADVSDVEEFAGSSAEIQDLVLHFIAATHGRARPCFPAEEVFDPELARERYLEIGREVPRRFVRLQRKYGRWGLAYLESLVRAADAAASRRIRPDGGER